MFILSPPLMWIRRSICLKPNFEGSREYVLMKYSLSNRFRLPKVTLLERSGFEDISFVVNLPPEFESNFNSFVSEADSLESIAEFSSAGKHIAKYFSPNI